MSSGGFDSDEVNLDLPLWITINYTTLEAEPL
jgi:hypothetical protein